MRVDDYLIDENASLRDTLTKMNINGIPIIFVVDGKELTGVVSSGDIRRFMTDNTLMNTPITKFMNLNPIYGYNIEQAKYKAIQYDIVPIINTNNEIIDIAIKKGNDVIVIGNGSNNLIEIDNKLVGEGQPCYVIAEACDNHLGNIDVAKAMIMNAKLFRADAIKFQHHLVDEEMLKDMKMSKNFNMHLYDFLKKYALTLKQHKELKRYCDKVRITYLCTPFSKKAAEQIKDLVPAFKIGSGELTDIPTLKYIASLGKPMILSTGMSTLEEIDETVSEIRNINEKIILMNCTSEYPPDYKDINLGNIKILKERYGLVIGHSDHTPSIYTSLAAIALGAKVIEKHYIIDKLQECPDQTVSINTSDFYNLIDGIRKIELSMGNTKQVNKLETPVRSWARRSVVSLVDIKKGQKITKRMVWTKRPGTGIEPKYLDKVIGMTARINIKKNKIIKWVDLT